MVYFVVSRLVNLHLRHNCPYGLTEAVSGQIKGTNLYGAHKWSAGNIKTIEHSVIRQSKNVHADLGCIQSGYIWLLKTRVRFP